MNQEELLKLKCDVDELGMYYASIKKEIEELKERVYSNNMIDESDKYYGCDLTDSNIISKYRNKTDIIFYGLFTINFILNKLFGQLFFDINVNLGVSFQIINLVLNLSIFSWSMYRHFIGETSAPEKYRKKYADKCAKEERLELEEGKRKIKILNEREEIVYQKYNDLANKYQNEISKLNDEERTRYNECVSEYILELLNSADSKIKSSIVVTSMSDEGFLKIAKKYELKKVEEK